MAMASAISLVEYSWSPSMVVAVCPLNTVRRFDVILWWFIRTAEEARV